MLFLAKLVLMLMKVGIGPGSICTTRVIAGVGVPQGLLSMMQLVLRVNMENHYCLMVVSSIQVTL